MVVGELVDRYVAGDHFTQLRSKRDRLRQLMWRKKQIGHCLLADVTPAVVAECRDILSRGETPKGGSRQPATVNRYLAALSRAFRVAATEWGWLDDNPLRNVSKLKEPRGRVRFLSDEERQALLSACRESRNPYLYPIVMMALCTGMRHAEIMNLTWDDIDLDRRRVVLQETKNQDRRSVPIVGPLFEIFKSLSSERRRIDTALVFPAAQRIGRETKPIDIQNAWRVALKRAHIEDFRFHDLRHSAASYLAMNGATLAEIAQVLGHKTLQMIKRYGHFTEQHTAKVLERMANNVFASPATER